MKNNSTKVWLFILSTCLAFLVIGYNLDSRRGLFVGFLAAIALNALIFFFGESHLLRYLKAQRLRGQDSWGLQKMTQQLCEQLDIPEPRLFIVNSNTPTSFCVGHTWRRASLGITTSLLEKFNHEELRAIIAHQLCHIRRLDSFGFGVSSILANSIVGVGSFLDQFWPPNFFLNKKQTPFMTLLSPLGWVIIKLVVGQKSFYANDALTLQVLQDRVILGEALWRLEGMAQTQPLKVPPCTSHLFIVNPEGFEQRNVFLKSHPPIEQRLKKLLGYYPI